VGVLFGIKIGRREANVNGEKEGESWLPEWTGNRHGRKWTGNGLKWTGSQETNLLNESFLTALFSGFLYFFRPRSF
jgi:hypothetical protein